MAKVFLLIGFVVAVVSLVYKFGFADPKNESENRIRPEDSNAPLLKKDNDKMIIIRNLSLNYLKRAIEQFCNIYNKQKVIVKLKLDVLENQYLITFPYEIDFEHFCYFINYLKYANDLCLKPDYKPDIIAWCSTKKGDSWMTDQLLNKRVMLYIPESDKDYDNVYLTTEYNLGFKMGFAIGESHIKLDRPVVDYKNPPTDIFKISSDQSMDFD
jgi:hypothetical protein